MKTILSLLALAMLLIAGTAAFIWSGFYDIAADQPHWALTEYAMDTVRDRSIRRRAAAIAVPPLDDASLVGMGAGNYDAMCAECHLKPGVEGTELGNGLFPAPPNLSRTRIDDAAAAFWTVKHGIKMTGMPAWGTSMDDKAIWGMVAFLRMLPGMSEADYRKLVASSEGHSHGTPEKSASPHIHDEASSPDHKK
jgi:mono/diheme cytochrome c family protein